MNKTNYLLSFSLILFFLGTDAAHTASSRIGVENSSLKTINTFWMKLREKSSFSHFSIFEGPAVDDISENVSDEDGERDGKINSWHQISYRYKLSDRFNFVINPRFAITYASDKEDDSNQFELLNPVIGIAGTWYKNGRFTFSGGLNTMLVNVEEGTREDGLLANPGGFQTLNFAANESFDVGSWLWFRFYVYDDSIEEEKFQSTISPYVTYKYSDNLSFQIWYDTFVSDDETDSAAQVFLEEDTDIGIGFYYSISKKLTIFPHLKTNPDQNYALNSTSINAWLFGSF
jgi:hypothetical protein